MEYRILGPLEVRDDARVLALGGAKPRAVLAMLLLHPDQAVSADRLARALWGEDAPSGAVKTVHVHVSRLRKALGDAELIVSTPAGYRVRIGPGELDAARFDRLVEDGRRALSDGRPEHAGDLLREALDLWRGPPLGELASEPFAPAAIARMEEQQLAALEARLEADLAAGRHASLVGELQQLAAEYPTRERLTELLMLALYRCGRQADALDAYTRARRRLVEDVGVEPGPALHRLHEEILRHDGSLVLAPLPPQLDASTALPLAGREAELAWLRQRWARASDGHSALIAVTGESGIGKSRLVAELAGEVHRHGHQVVYVAGEGVPPSEALEATRPTLIVIDSADRADPEALTPRPGVPVLAVALCASADGLGRHDVLELPPLGEQAIGAIARAYAPAAARDSVPIAWLLETTGGGARRVHELSSQWARREAASRAGAAAGRAAMGRRDLRELESDLVGDVEEPQASSRRLALATEHGVEVVCPYKGLAPYTAADTEYFFGRTRLIGELVARLVGAPLLGVVGPSGSGKSSVLHAGLLPVLAGGVIPGSEEWRQVVIRPGEHPLRELRTAGLGGDGNQPVLLAVDQFEEVFTACGDEAERAAFIAELTRGSQTVLLALRADHYGRCAEYPELAELLAAGHVLVGPMRREELREAIDGPAERAGLLVEREVADALVDDVAGEPGALPLLSSALLELWQQRDGRRLRYASYLAGGGVRGAVARWAEDAYKSLDREQQAVARPLFLRLTTEGADGAVERRRVPLAELDRERALPVVEALAERRLLILSAGTVEVAHEALLREWPRLRLWVEEDRDGMRIQRELASAAKRWEGVDRDEGALVRGAELEAARGWHAREDTALSPLEQEFLGASEARARSERLAARRRRRLFSGGAAVVLVAVVGIVLAVVFTRRERDLAASRDLAAKATSVLAADPSLGLAIAFEAMRRRATPEAESAVRQATLAHRTTVLTEAHKGYILDVALNRDGTRLVTGGEDGRARVWDSATGRLVASSDDREPVNAAALSPDDQRLAIVTADGAIALATLPDGRRRELLRLPGSDVARSVVFTPDGKRLVVATTNGVVGTVPLDASRPRLEPLATHAGRALARLSPDGTRVVGSAEDGTAEIVALDGADPAVRIKGAEAFQDADFSADGSQVITAQADGSVTVWDARDGHEVRRVKVTDAMLMSARFGPNGRVVTTDLNGVVSVVAIEAGVVVARLAGHDGPTYDALFLRDGGKVASVGQDGTLRVWAPLPIAAVITGGEPGMINASADGRHAAAGYEDGAVRILDLAGGKPVDLPGFTDISEAYYAPNGAFVASASYDGGVGLWDVRRRQPVPVKTDDADKEAVGVDGSGRRIAFAAVGEDPVLQAPDGSDRRTLRGHTAGVTALVFSPDGKHLLSASEDTTLRLWSTASGSVEHVLRGHDKAVYDANYSADGSRIISADTDGTVRVWTASGEPVSALYGHEGTVNTAVLDRDGRHAVTAGYDGTIRVWDASNGHLLAIVHRFDGPATAAGFTAGGTRVAALGGDGVVLSIPCEVCGSYADVTRLAGTRLTRRLTAGERERLLD